MLRGYTARLGKRQKLCSNFYSPSNLQHTAPSIHFHQNIRLIQLLIFNNSNINTNNNSIISPFTSSYHHKNNQSSSHPLQYFNHRTVIVEPPHISLPPHEIVGLPALSPSVEESKIVSWKKEEGDLVAADEAIASIQTDKAELDWQVTDDVYLAKILLQPGQTVPVGTPSCIFVEEADMVAAFKNYDAATAASPQSQSQPSPQSPQSPEPSKPSTPPPPPTQSQGNFPEHRVEGMPALSPTATDGAVVEWLVKEGDMVEEGSGIAEIQTDKSVVTWTSTDEAYVAKLLVPANPDEKLLVNAPLAVFVDKKGDVAAFKDFVVAAVASQSSTTPSQPSPSTQKKETTPTKSDTPQTVDAGGRIMASPYAKKLAKEMGVSLDNIGTGSGDKGRIIANDVLSSKDKTASKPAVTDKKAAAVSTPKPVRIISG
eukprot:19989_1